MPAMGATATPLGDEHGFRLTEWRLPPSTSTGWHVHELPYTVVPLTDGLMRIETPDGWIDFPIEIGKSTRLNSSHVSESRMPSSA